MVTYDSFSRLLPYIDNTFQIIVDEFSELLDAYNYRNKAISKLFKSLEIFTKISYVSATTIKEKYLPPILKNLPTTNIDWEDLTKINIDLLHKKRPIQAVKTLITKYRSGLVEVNGIKSNSAYFFVNSVRMIRDICDKCELLNSEVRIICSNNPKNERTLGEYDISTSLDPEKLINFITSCSFKGLDFYSELGVVFVVSNNTNKHTLITIDTDIIQIAGRIRNPSNPFRNYLCHIFNVNPLELNNEEFERVTNEKKEKSNVAINTFNKLDPVEKEQFIEKYSLEDLYISINDENKTIYYDEMLYLLDQRRYEDICQVYKDGLSVSSYYNSLDKVEVFTTNQIDVGYLVDNSFYSLCKTLCEGKGDKESIYKEFPLIEEGAEKLGLKKLKALGYNPTKIRNELNNLNIKDDIDLEIKKLFTPGFYPSKDVKIKLEILYRNLGINKKAKASDLKNALNVKSTTKRIDSLVVSGYQVS